MTSTSSTDRGRGAPDALRRNTPSHHRMTARLTERGVVLADERHDVEAGEALARLRRLDGTLRAKLRRRTERGRVARPAHLLR